MNILIGHARGLHAKEDYTNLDSKKFAVQTEKIC